MVAVLRVLPDPAVTVLILPVPGVSVDVMESLKDELPRSDVFPVKVLARDSTGARTERDGSTGESEATRCS